MMRVIPASAVVGRSCVYTVQCTTGGMSITAYYSAREPANMGRNNYLTPLSTFTIHLSLYSIVQCSLSHILNVISMRPVPSLHPFCYHTSVARCIPGMHLPWDATSKGRIVQGMKRSGTHRHATVTPTNPSPLLSANTHLKSQGVFRGQI
jgi:hypothetical protein